MMFRIFQRIKGTMRSFERLDDQDARNPHEALVKMFQRKVKKYVAENILVFPHSRPDLWPSPEASKEALTLGTSYRPELGLNPTGFSDPSANPPRQMTSEQADFMRWV